MGDRVCGGVGDGWVRPTLRTCCCSPATSSLKYRRSSSASCRRPDSKDTWGQQVRGRVGWGGVGLGYGSVRYGGVG